MSEVGNSTDDAPNKPAVLPVQFFWATWAIGPASYGLAYAYCLARPAMCDANLMLACVMVLTHSVAGLMTVLLLGGSGAHRGRIECYRLGRACLDGLVIVFRYPG